MQILGWKLVKVSSNGYIPPDLQALESAFVELAQDVAAVKVQLSRVERKVYRTKNPEQEPEPVETVGPAAQVSPLQNLRSGDSVPPEFFGGV
jgi:hypothetical protein